ncbi:MAG: carboxypeptidase-like regulatory domain-containing protein [Acidobacteriota bacterium]
MINRMFVTLCAMALLFMQIACLGRQGGQHVSLTFVYPDAPEIVEYQDVRPVKSLSGIVLNPQDDAVGDALVAVLSVATKVRLDAVLSGKDGKFNLGPQNSTGAYLVRFSKPGFNTVVIRIKLSRVGAQDISVTLPYSAGSPVI